jgi:hypothetical protein
MWLYWWLKTSRQLVLAAAFPAAAGTAELNVRTADMATTPSAIRERTGRVTDCLAVWG